MSMSGTDVIQLIAAIAGLLAALTATTWLPFLLAKNIGYLRNFRANTEQLTRQNKELARLIDKADRERRGTRVPRAINHLNDWVTNAQILVREINNLRMEETESSPTCWSKFRTGKLIAQKIEEIKSRVQQYTHITALVRTSSIRGEIKLAVHLVGRNANDAVANIQRYLIHHNEVRIIGVSGLSGIGKTAVVKMVNNQIINEGNAFDFVIWVEVPLETQLVNLQRELARKIDPSICIADDTNSNADNLRDALLRKRRFLLVLDDMQRAFDLRDVGIPNPAEANGCKLIIVSRSSDECHAMTTDVIVNMELLSADEAWELFFREVGGERVHYSQQTTSLMRDVANECGGLPSTIITAARSARNFADNPEAWQKALSEMRESRLKFTYNTLQEDENRKTKACFLYCALYPTNHAIETKELMEYWIWAGLLGDVDWLSLKMKQAKEILKEIIDAGLLESSGEEGGVELVKMPAVSRDMALDITKRDPIFFIHAGHTNEKPLHTGQWPVNVQRVSMMRNDFKEFPTGVPQCPQLCSLLLQHNSLDGKNGRGDFFVHLPNLKHLDLSYTGIRRLPKSLSGLKKLRALILCSCWNLKDLPSLSPLLELLVLDLTDTHIEQLPEGMENLTKLKRLSLTRTGNVHLIFQATLIYALRNLEELLVDGCGFLWDVKSSPSNIASISDLFWLKRLLVLEVNFLDARAYNEYILSERPYQFQRFKFRVGLYDGNLRNNSVAVLGGLLANDKPIRLPNDTFELHVTQCNEAIKLPGFDAKNLQILDVSDCSNLEYLFEMSMMQYLENIIEIIVKRCPKMVALLQQEIAGDRVELVDLSRLQKLVLSDLEKLEFLYDGQVVECNSLKTIVVWKCPQLKKFPVLAEGLDDLVEIQAESAWFESLTNTPAQKELLRPFLKEYMPGEESYRPDTAPSTHPSNGGAGNWWPAFMRRRPN